MLKKGNEIENNTLSWQQADWSFPGPGVECTRIEKEQEGPL